MSRIKVSLLLFLSITFGAWSCNRATPEGKAGQAAEDIAVAIHQGADSVHQLTQGASPVLSHDQEVVVDNGLMAVANLNGNYIACIKLFHDGKSTVQYSQCASTFLDTIAQPEFLHTIHVDDAQEQDAIMHSISLVKTILQNVVNDLSTTAAKPTAATK